MRPIEEEPADPPIGGVGAGRRYLEREGLISVLLAHRPPTKHRLHQTGIDHGLLNAYRAQAGIQHAREPQVGTYSAGAVAAGDG